MKNIYIYIKIYIICIVHLNTVETMLWWWWWLISLVFHPIRRGKRDHWSHFRIVPINNSGNMKKGSIFNSYTVRMEPMLFHLCVESMKAACDPQIRVLVVISWGYGMRVCSHSIHVVKVCRSGMGYVLISCFMAHLPWKLRLVRSPDLGDSSNFLEYGVNECSHPNPSSKVCRCGLEGERIPHSIHVFGYGVRECSPTSSMK